MKEFCTQIIIFFSCLKNVSIFYYINSCLSIIHYIALEMHMGLGYSTSVKCGWCHFREHSGPQWDKVAAWECA